MEHTDSERRSRRILDLEPKAALRQPEPRAQVSEHTRRRQRASSGAGDIRDEKFKLATAGPEGCGQATGLWIIDVELTTWRTLAVATQGGRQWAGSTPGEATTAGFYTHGDVAGFQVNVQVEPHEHMPG